MARTRIPDGITRDDVLQAIGDIKAGTVTHEFDESERYDLVHEGERYAPKASLCQLPCDAAPPGSCDQHRGVAAEFEVMFDPVP